MGSKLKQLCYSQLSTQLLSSCFLPTSATSWPPATSFFPALRRGKHASSPVNSAYLSGDLCSSENACRLSGPVEPQPFIARLSVSKEPPVTCYNCSPQSHQTPIKHLIACRSLSFSLSLHLIVMRKKTSTLFKLLEGIVKNKGMKNQSNMP